MICPHLEPPAVWSPHMKKTLENVQRRAHQNNCQKFQSYATVRDLDKLDLPTLRYRRIRGDMIEVFKNTKVLRLRSQSNSAETHKQCNSNLRLYSFSIRVRKMEQFGESGGITLGCLAHLVLSQAITGWPSQAISMIQAVIESWHTRRIRHCR